jgi:hypothetical protein
MKKIIAIVALSIAQPTFAQQAFDDYIFKVQTGQVYKPLTSGANITSGLTWDEESFKIPMGFSAKIGSTIISDFALSLSFGFAPATDTMGIIQGFAAFSGADLEDRGWLTGTASSPIRYLVTGVAPNRIFKLELCNAGFFDEEMNYGTLNDSINMQIWVYETSNIVEIRYGSSQISHPSDYFSFGNAPLMGMVKDFDFSATTFSTMYQLTGSASSPLVDSTTDIASLTTLNDYPAEGTVYRFIPKATATGIGALNLINQLQVYPTVVSHSITINSQIDGIHAQVLDMSGKLVFNPGVLSMGKSVLDISSLASGMYMLHLSSQQGNALYKIMKQ